MRGPRSGGLIPGPRPLVIDRRGSARDFPGAIPRIIGYVESSADYHNVYGGSNALGVILSLPNLYFDGKTRVYVEYNAPWGMAYYNLSCELRLDDVSFAYSLCTSAGGNLGTARQRVSGFITPSRGFHTITATGFGAGGGASGAGIFYGAAPFQSYLLVKESPEPRYNPAHETSLALVSTSQATAGTPVVIPAMAVATGNHLFVWSAGGDATSSVTDTAGNVYTGATQKVYGGSTKGRWFYCLNAVGHVANVTTVNFAIANGGNQAQAIQFTGPLTAFDAEQTGSNQGDVTCGNCAGAITTTGTKPLIMLGIAGGNMTTQGGSFNFGTLIPSSTLIGQAAYYLPGGPSSSLFTWSGMPNQAHVMGVVAFK